MSKKISASDQLIYQSKAFLKAFNKCQTSLLNWKSYVKKKILIEKFLM